MAGRGSGKSSGGDAPGCGGRLVSVEEDRKLVPGLMPCGSWENWAGKSSSEAEGAGMVRRSSALENLDNWKSRDQCVQIHDGCLQRRGLNWAGAGVVHGVQGTLEWAWFQVPGAVTGWLHWEKPVWLALGGSSLLLYIFSASAGESSRPRKMSLGKLWRTCTVWLTRRPSIGISMSLALQLWWGLSVPS